MRGRHVGVLSGFLVVWLLLSTVFVAIASQPTSVGPQPDQVGPTLNWRYWDFFNVPYGEIWDYRFTKYGDLPINAECFNQTAINDGICLASDPLIQNTVSYPYTNWYPSPGATYGDNVLPPGDPKNNPFIYAPYRFSVDAHNIPGYNRSEPVFLPVFNYGAPPGNRLDFDWNMDYVTRAEQTVLRAAGCGPALTALDGFVLRSQVTLTMDHAQAERMFNPGDTGTFSATANQLTGWTNPAQGRGSDNLYATTSTTNANTYYNNYQIIPQEVGGTSPILQVEVGLEGFTAGDDDVRVEFSTDGGATYATAGTVNLGLTDTTTFFDVTALRTWTATLLNNANFRVKITYVSVPPVNSVNSVDNVPVRVRSDKGIWWAANALPTCPRYGALEAAVEDWFTRMGRTKYDITNSYEYDYSPFSTQMSATVDLASGLTTVTIDHMSFGTEVLLARWFYWGNASYEAHHLDSTKRAGWWGMELAWFEDFRFFGTLGPSIMDFTLSSVMQYHFQQLTLPGPNGIYDRTDDIPIWTWGPILSDYTDDFSGAHPISELDRYPSAAEGAPPRPYSFVHSTPGSPSTFYGQLQPYDYPPLTWDLKADETMRFEFPANTVVFWDPNLTPLGAHPRRAEYVARAAPLEFRSTRPASYGTWDATGHTWTITGPTVTGGPVGSPGPDRVPGTGDDQYALDPWGSITFGPGIGIDATIQAPWTQLYVGQAMDFAVVATVQGAPLPGASVTASAPGATLTPGSGTTDAQGRWTSRITPDAGSGGTTITLSTGVILAPYAPDSATHAIAVLAEPLSMAIASMTSNRVEMMSFETATIRVQLSSGGTGVEDGLLTPSTRFGGTFTAVADLGGGAYQFGWTAPVRTTQGFARIDVRARAGGYTDATSFTTILVDPNKTNEIDPTQLFLLTSLPATSVVVGNSLQVTIYLFTIEGFVVSGGTVTARLFGVGSITAVVDHLNGVYRLTYNAPASVAGPTNIRIDITSNKFGYAVGTTRVGITVLPAA